MVSKSPSPNVHNHCEIVSPATEERSVKLTTLPSQAIAGVKEKSATGMLFTLMVWFTVSLQPLEATTIICTAYEATTGR